MAGIFKAYDIRGIYPDQLDEDMTFNIGRAYADMLKEELQKDNITIAVGRDMRLSSPQLHKKVIEGITKQGVNVIDIGLVSTPTFYFGVSKLNTDGGMTISASHNPKEYNGVKITKKRAFPVGYDTGINEIEKRVQEKNFSDSETVGKITKNDHVLNDEVLFSLQHANPESIKPFKIVIDTANAMGGQYLKVLFEHLPCTIIWMNDKLDGTFPAHTADPFKEENVADLKKKVIEEKADLGIATDGDGDRIFFIDNEGEMVEPAIVRGLMAKIALREHPGATICYDIRPGKITRDMIIENGGTPVVTKVGHSLIKAKAIEVGAEFAGESSGHFFFKTEYGFFETPMIVALKLLEEISNENKPISDIVTPLRKYFHSGEINSKADDKQGIMKKVEQHYNDAKISHLDGITVEYDDFWFNVRPSNTESLLRLNLEAISKEIMEKRRDEVLAIIKS